MRCVEMRHRRERPRGALSWCPAVGNKEKCPVRNRIGPGPGGEVGSDLSGEPGPAPGGGPGLVHELKVKAVITEAQLPAVGVPPTFWVKE